MQTVEQNSKEEIQFTMPNMTALFINSAYSHQQCAQELLPEISNNMMKWKENKKRICSIQDERLFFDYLEHMSSSIVFAITSLESFANEQISTLAEKHEYSYKKADGTTKVIIREDIEKIVPITDKLCKILPNDVFKLRINKNCSQWLNFKSLLKIRNEIIHIKYNNKRVKKSKKVFKEIFPKKDDKLPVKPFNVAIELIRYFYRDHNTTPRWLLKCPHI